MIKLTETAETVLGRRYYLKNKKGEIIEDWNKLCMRVAKHVAIPDLEYNDKMEDAFYNIIYNLDFLPNSPCLMNAGIALGQLSACFVLPIEDDLRSIFKTIGDAAIVNKTGGGTGFSFSNIRPKNSEVLTTQGVASGPLSFASVFDSATDVIKQGGRRRGANMGVLRIDHPDILDFIHAKEKDGVFKNFNFSVAITDDFMKRVKNGKNYDLINPRTNKKCGELNAKQVFDILISKAWIGGDPGVLFLDTANKFNPTPHLGDFEATNPCSEQWLLPYESCNLGSINLANFVNDGKIDYKRLGQVSRTATRFLDNVIDVNVFPIDEIKEMTLKTRKIGLGVMGMHDLLIKLELEYDSDEAREISSNIMNFVRDEAKKESENLAKIKGVFPAYDKKYCDFEERRNAALTSIQPTGTVSMIAGCSSGIEPYYAIVTIKNVMDNDKLLLVNKTFEDVAKKEGFYSEELIREISDKGTVVGNKVPEKWQKIFCGAMDISIEGHLKMQAVLQNNGVDASISKTINMHSYATKEDVEKVYLMAHKLGCKGVTIYRDGSKAEQVLNTGSKREENLKSNIKKDLPDELFAKRYRLKSIDGESIYIIVCFDENEEPIEVFAKFSYDNRTEYKEKTMMWTTVCRLVSLSLRCGTPIEEIIKQLDRSSGSMFDLPAQLGKLLKTFMSKTKNGYKKECVECGGEVVFTEGCEKCLSCGNSKCS